MSTDSQTKRSQAELEQLLAQELPEGVVKARDGNKVKNKKTGNWETAVWEYLEHEYVRERLCALFGLDFDCDVHQVAVVNGKSTKGTPSVAVTIKLTVVMRYGYTNGGTFRTTVRAAHGTHTSYDPDPAAAYAKAVKSAESNAWKRVGITLGRSFGLGLESEGADDTSDDEEEAPSESPRETRAQGRPVAAAAATAATATAPTTTTAASGGAPTTTPATTENQDAVRTAFEAIGIKGDMLARLMAYPADQLVDPARVDVVVSALQAAIPGGKGKEMVAQAFNAIGPRDQLNGVQFRRLVYALARESAKANNH